MRLTWLLFFVSSVVLFSCKNETGNSSKEDNTLITKDSTAQTNNPDSYSNGVKKFEGKMQNGKREGEWKSYYENGNVWSTGTFINGLRQGEGVVYYSNGAKYIVGHYKDDRRFGKWTFYNADGSIIKEESFK